MALLDSDGGKERAGRVEGSGRSLLSIYRRPPAPKAETVFSSRFQRVFPYPMAESPV